MCTIGYFKPILHLKTYFENCYCKLTTHLANYAWLSKSELQSKQKNAYIYARY